MGRGSPAAAAWLPHSCRMAAAWLPHTPATTGSGGGGEKANARAIGTSLGKPLGNSTMKSKIRTNQVNLKILGNLILHYKANFGAG